MENHCVAWYNYTMQDFTAAFALHKNLPVADQVQAGQATGTTMDDKHVKFLAELIKMLDEKVMDASIPKSLVKQEIYDALSPEQKDAVDLALMNLADQLRHIESYFRSTKTPNASPELQTMIEHFWDIKSRLEDKYGDVLKF